MSRLWTLALFLAFSLPVGGESAAGLFSGMATRSRVVQISMCCMALAVFIIMWKKFDGGGSPRRPGPPQP